MASVGDGQSKTRAACCLSRARLRPVPRRGRELRGASDGRARRPDATYRVVSRPLASSHPAKCRAVRPLVRRIIRLLHGPTSRAPSPPARRLRLPSLDRPPPARARQHLRVYYRLLGSLNSLVASLYIHHVNCPRLTSTRQPVAGALTFPSAAQSVRSRHARRRLTVTSRCDTNSLRRRAAAAAADTRRKPTATNRAVL